MFGDAYCSMPKGTVGTFYELSDIPAPIVLHKLSSKTNPIDLRKKNHEMPIEMSRKLGNSRTHIGRVWRCRIGQQRRWHYGWSAEEALSAALQGGGIER